MAERRIALLIACLAASCVCVAQLDEDTHTVTIKVTSDLDNGPLEGARVWVTGPKVLALDYPHDYVHRLEIRGVKTDTTGRVVVKLGPGTYRMQVKHDTHLNIEDWTFTVPDPRDPDRRVHQLMPRLKMKQRYRDGMKRTVEVVVTGPREDADGRVTEGPLTNALVHVYSDTGDFLKGTDVDEEGSATFESPGWFVGDILRVEASAEGYRAESRRFAIGALPAAAGTSPWDEVRLRLEKELATGIWLDIQVLGADDDSPIANATVAIERVGGQSSVLGKTDAQGKLPHVELLADPDPNDPGEYRLKVTHQAYEEKWDDLPGEYLQPTTEARGYTVFLSEAPPAAIGKMTACERQSFEAFRAFALSKDPELDIRDELGEIHVVWHEQRERNGEMEEVRLNAMLKHYRTRDPRTLEMRVGDGPYDHKPATIGGHEGSSDGASYYWKVGRFDVHTGMGSWWNGWPTPEDGKVLAEQVAALVSKCP